MNLNDHAGLRRILLRVQVVAFLASLIMGCILSSAMPNRFVARPDPIPVSETTAVRFRAILKGNLRVSGIIVLGSSTAGIVSVVYLMDNGFLFGIDLIHLIETRPRVVPFLLVYAPIELTAFLLASYGSAWLAVFFWQVIESYPSTEALQEAICSILLAFVLLAVAAGLESALADQMRREAQYLRESDGTMTVGLDYFRGPLIPKSLKLSLDTNRAGLLDGSSIEGMHSVGLWLGAESVPRCGVVSFQVWKSPLAPPPKQP
jgi:uncharacterized membrane protein SpoIIM required for sporulation